MSKHANAWPRYADVWRFHFYAGMFCIPFVLVLAITGTVYLFRPQIEAWQERDFDSLTAGTSPAASFADQIRAAIDAVPGGKLAALERNAFDEASQASATRVVVVRGRERVRVFVDPRDARVLGQVVESERLVQIAKRIHGELLLGKRGSYLVELAASWTIVMVVTGMVLWMPRSLRFAGVVYPRLTATGKRFWKDLHSVGGFWASGLIVFLVATGLPWSTFWGDYFKRARSMAGLTATAQHWDGGHGEHAEHEPPAKAKPAAGPSWLRPVPNPDQYDLSQVDGVAKVAATLALEPPIVILPPPGDAIWTIKSETANRPLQETVRLDGDTQTIVGRDTFADRHWVDQLVGQGIALHEGARFGWLNQLIALVATVSLVMLSLTGVTLWWRRRRGPGLSPPRRGHAGGDESVSRVRAAAVAVGALLLGVYLPLFGASLLLVIVVDRWLLSRWTPAAAWLGLASR